MKTDTNERQPIETFEICKEIEISAPIDISVLRTIRICANHQEIFLR
jgi:hypothetical protein